MRYYQEKLSSLYNIKIISDYENLYKVDLTLFDCIVNIDCDTYNYISYIIRNRVPLLNLSLIDSTNLVKIAKKNHSSLICCEFCSLGYLSIKNLLNSLKNDYIIKEETTKEQKNIILNNGLEVIKIEISLLHNDAILNNMIDYINILLNKSIIKVF